MLSSWYSHPWSRLFGLWTCIRTRRYSRSVSTGSDLQAGLKQVLLQQWLLSFWSTDKKQHSFHHFFTHVCCCFSLWNRLNAGNSETCFLFWCSQSCLSKNLKQVRQSGLLKNVAYWSLIAPVAGDSKVFLCWKILCEWIIFICFSLICSSSSNAGGMFFSQWYLAELWASW